MKTIKIRSTFKNTVCAFAILPLLTACGGGSEDVNTSGCSILEALTTLCIGAALNQALAGGSSSGGSTSSGGQTVATTGGTGGVSGGSDTGGASGGSNTVRVTRSNEWEPNNLLDNANLVAFPSVSGGDHAAIEITGSVQDDTDPSDFFIITPPTSGDYLVYLCLESCTDHPIDDAAYLMVYDQSQTTIASTPVGIESEKFLSVSLTAGLAYYVEVNGYDTVQMPYDYKLVIIN